MGEGLDAAIGTEIVGGLNEANAHLQSLENNASGPSQSLDGVTEISGDIREANDHLSHIETSLSDGKGGWFHDMLQQLIGHQDVTDSGDQEARDLQNSMIDSLNEMVHFNDVTDKANKKEKQKKPKGTSAKFDDLKDLPWEIGTLGAVLANTFKKKDEGGKSGISGFFKGLMEGVGGIASLGVALLAFAGATLLFNFVDWGKAVIGMLAFTVFTIGMVALAKIVGKNTADLVKFAEGSLVMSAALGVFAISLWLVSAVVSGRQFDLGPIHIAAFSIKSAATGIGLFLAFELGMVGIAKLVGQGIGDFTKFATGSIIMCAALAAFAISLVIVSNVMAAKGFDVLGYHLDAINMVEAGKGVLAFLGFEIGLAVVAKIVGNSTGDFVKFALGSLLMCAALVAFAFSLVIVSGILTNGVNIDALNIHLPAADPVAAALGIAGFLVFLIAVVVLANVASGFMGQIAIFGVVSILMSVSLMLFSIAMITAGVAAFGGEAEIFGAKFSAPKANGLKALAAIPLMAAFMAAFAGLGAVFLIPFAGQAMLAGIMAASVVLLAIGSTVIVMAKAMALAGLITSGGTMKWDGQEYTMVPMDESKIDASFDPFFVLMDKVVEMGKKIKGNGGFFPWQKKSGVDEGAIRMVGSVADVIVKIAECIAESMTIKKKVEDAGAVWDVHVMDGCLDYVLLVVDRLAEVADKMGWLAAVKMKLITQSMMPVIDAMDKIVDVIEKALTMKKRLQDQGVTFVGPGIDPEILNGICDPVLQVMLGPNMDGEGGLAGAADNLGYWGAKALEKVTASMLPVAQTISILVDCIEKAANLGGGAESAKELIDTAVKNMSIIMVGDGSTESSGALFWKKETITGGFVGLFNQISKGINAVGDISGTIDSMKSLADAIVSIMDAFSKLTSVDIGDVGKVIDNFGRILGQKSYCSTSYSWWSGFNVEKNSAIGLMAIIELLGDVGTKELQTATDNAGKLKDLITNSAEAMKACSSMTGADFQMLADIPDLGGFAKSMDKFDDGMKYMAKAYNRVKDIPNKWINTIGESFEKISEAKLDNLDKMALFSEKAKALGTTADNLERIANAFKKINKENGQNALSSAADKLGGIVSDAVGFFSTDVSKKKVEGEQTDVKPVPKGQELATIAKIMSDWNAKGVPVIGPKTPTKENAVKTLSI